MAAKLKPMPELYEKGKNILGSMPKGFKVPPKKGK